MQRIHLKRRYKEAKKEICCGSKDWDESYSELEIPEEEKKLFKIAKKRDKAGKNLTQIKQI